MGLTAVNDHNHHSAVLLLPDGCPRPAAPAAVAGGNQPFAVGNNPGVEHNRFGDTHLLKLVDGIFTDDQHTFFGETHHMLGNAAVLIRIQNVAAGNNKADGRKTVAKPVRVHKAAAVNARISAGSLHHGGDALAFAAFGRNHHADGAGIVNVHFFPFPQGSGNIFNLDQFFGRTFDRFAFPVHINHAEVLAFGSHQFPVKVKLGDHTVPLIPADEHPCP
ncbi:hypothetical protein D3C75_778910 [compost metagenome]